MHVYGGGDFCINSTSHIESILSQLKSFLKNIYYIIPHNNFNLLLREAEWRQINRNKNLDEKIVEFFADRELIYQIEAENFESDLYFIEKIINL